MLSIEANPLIYNTNFINYTAEAINLAKDINHPGFKINLDLGTMIYYNENLSLLDRNMDLVNHVHISEPRLAKIEDRALHKDLFHLLKASDYKHYISIEMGKNNNTLTDVVNVMIYVAKYCI